MFKYLISFFCVFIVCTSPAAAWDSYEHSEIGDAAFQKAARLLERSKVNSWRNLSRQPFVHTGHEMLSAVHNGREIARLSFGDLVAIYGDYAVRSEEVNGPKFKARVAALKAIVRGGNSKAHTHERDYAIQLAIGNVTHFSRSAAQAYVENHRKALLLAGTRFRLWEALHYEAMALHSLTDLFAFGHIHEDRRLSDRIIAWGNKRISPTGLSRATRQKIAKAMASAMGGYVNFYHNAYNWRGAMLKNLAGDIWRGYGDKRFRIVDPGCAETSVVGRRKCRDVKTERQRAIIVHAAAVSILSVLRTAAGRPPPFGKGFKAMCYIPVTYWDTKPPVPPQNQKTEIGKMTAALKDKGIDPTKTGFDFSLGILKYRDHEMRGSVDYAGYARLFCGKI